MAEITAIVIPCRGSRRRLVELDGSGWRETSSDVLAALGVREGANVEPSELAAALDAVEPREAKQRAIRLLEYRERSVHEVQGRLVDDGYPRETVEGSLEDLVRLGLLDDARYAGMQARLLTKVRGMGRSRALRELSAKGVAPELAADAVEEALPPEAEAEAALALAWSSARRAGATRERVAARLVRKGYAPRVAFQAARVVFADGIDSVELADASFDEPVDLRESDD